MIAPMETSLAAPALGRRGSGAHRHVSTLGVLLKEWRGLRRKSQLALAMDLRMSPRFLSFVESGRSAPSRETVLALAEALQVPFRERNALLMAAGFAPLYPVSPLDSPEMLQVQHALGRLLAHQEPYPAVVLDRQWNVVQTNRAAPRLFGHFIDLSQLPEPRNLLRTIFDPAGMRPWVANWDEVARTLVQRVFREAVSGVPDSRTLALLDELSELGGVPAWRGAGVGEASLPFHPLRLEKGGDRLSFFSMVITVGAPTDVTAQELRVEALFPADEVTERFAREHLAE